MQKKNKKRQELESPVHPVDGNGVTSPVAITEHGQNMQGGEKSHRGGRPGGSGSGPVGIGRQVLRGVRKEVMVYVWAVDAGEPNSGRALSHLVLTG